MSTSRSRASLNPPNFPLISAVNDDNLPRLKQLLASGLNAMDPGQINTAGQTALHFASNRPDIVKVLLKAVRPDQLVECVNYQSNGSLVTPLILAVIEGNMEVVKMLIEAGADPTLANSRGGTPLKMAMRIGNPQMIEAISAPILKAELLTQLKSFARQLLQLSNINKNPYRILQPYLMKLKSMMIHLQQLWNYKKIKKVEKELYELMNSVDDIVVQSLNASLSNRMGFPDYTDCEA
jgi:ankyrin repeat protein